MLNHIQNKVSNRCSGITKKYILGEVDIQLIPDLAKEWVWDTVGSSEELKMSILLPHFVAFQITFLNIKGFILY